MSIHTMIFLIIVLCIYSIQVDPSPPSFAEKEIGDDYINITFHPSKFDEEVRERRPVGNTFYVQYREADTAEWKQIPQNGQYVPQKTLMPAERPEKGSTSTFV
uniref:Secreted protein n=1 Tax=Heterorhabditis bacteriophora TaxID=37862 RepID=A0A1I7XA91_HETBA